LKFSKSTSLRSRSEVSDSKRNRSRTKNKSISRLSAAISITGTQKWRRTMNRRSGTHIGPSTPPEYRTILSKARNECPGVQVDGQTYVPTRPTSIIGGSVDGGAHLLLSEQMAVAATTGDWPSCSSSSNGPSPMISSKTLSIAREAEMEDLLQQSIRGGGR
jgi:hypothetical protein